MKYFSRFCKWSLLIERFNQILLITEMKRKRAKGALENRANYDFDRKYRERGVVIQIPLQKISQYRSGSTLLYNWVRYLTRQFYSHYPTAPRDMARRCPMGQLRDAIKRWRPHDDQLGLRELLRASLSAIRGRSYRIMREFGSQWSCARLFSPAPSFLSSENYTEKSTSARETRIVRTIAAFVTSNYIARV